MTLRSTKQNESKLKEHLKLCSDGLAEGGLQIATKNNKRSMTVLEAKKKQTSTVCKDKSSAQIVRNGTAITMQLTLALAAYLVGVLHTILKTRTIDPEFEEDAIAFYQDALGIFPCSIVKRQLKANGPIYRVMTSSGLCVDKRPDELLTGW